MTSFWLRLAKWAVPLVVLAMGMSLMLWIVVLGGGSGSGLDASLASSICSPDPAAVTGALDDSKVAALAQQAGFPAEEIPTAIGIAHAESGLDPLAENLNTNGTKDHGLFQINDVNASVLAGGDWRSPADNTVMAFKIWKSWGNWKAWSTFNSGSYAKFVPDAVADSPLCSPQGVDGTCGQGLTDLHGFTNGEIPAKYLCPLWADSSQRLRADAAAAFDGLSKAYAEHFGSKPCVTDSYRTRAVQDRLWVTKPGLAARPGTSNHGWGQAVDLGCRANIAGSPVDVWLHANAPSFGWKHPSWAEPSGSMPEPWHWEFGVK